MNAPERIWLQDDGDYASAHEAGLGTEWGVTWCDISVNDMDTEYVRADLLEAERARADRLEAALRRLRKVAILLQTNSEGCAVNHYGVDFEVHGMPGWLMDTAADIAVATAALGDEVDT